MRFYEFKESKREIDVESVLLFDHDPRSLILTESESTTFKQYLEFISSYVTDPNTLVVNSNYYAFSISVQPQMKLMHIVYDDHPVTYLGLVNGYFKFTSETNNYKFPMTRNSDTVSLSTTIFEKAELANQFLTALSLQFAGIYNIIRTPI